MNEDDFAAVALASLLTPRQRAERLTGRMMGRWRLLDRRSSAGGFSVVYDAQHPQMGDGVVKVMAFDANENLEARSLFEREIKILKKLTDDPHVRFVPRIYDADVDECEGLAWIAMQRIDGQSLAEYLRKVRSDHQRLSTKQIGRVLSGALTALATVQEAYGTQQDSRAGNDADASLLGRVIVHGDIKPGNVLVSAMIDAPRAWLVDFGIARILRPVRNARESQPTLSPATAKNDTVTAAISAFTREYISPEMLAPHPALDVRSDLFQLGLIGYEMMTGGRYWDVWPDVDRDLAAAGYPQWLKHAIRRALDWNRDYRFQDAREFLDAISVFPRRLVAASRTKAKQLVAISVVGLSIAIAVMSWICWKRLYAWADGLSSANVVLRQANESLKIETETLKGLIKAKSPSEQLEEMRIRYVDLLNGNSSPSDVELLKNEAIAFSVGQPPHPFARQIKTIGECLAKMLSGGKVRVSVVKLEEKKWYGSWTLQYAIKNGAQAVQGERTFKKEATIDNASIEVPWRPDGTLTIDLTCKDRGTHGSVSIPLASPQVLQNDLVPAKAGTPDQNFDAIYTIERIGFSALPAFPQQ